MITPVDRLFEAHLTVSDLDASIAFYRDRVGLELAHVVSVRQAAFFWVGSRGSTMLGLWANDPDEHLLEYIAMLAEEPRPDGGVLRWHEWTQR
jgi:catechol 2,3-dioxygenase-like lactoylglutathione lyase family enzyme